MKLDKPFRKLSTRERALRKHMKIMLTAVSNIHDLGFNPRISGKTRAQVDPIVFIEVTDPNTGECWTVGEHRD
tara:strand:+ start:225 stop:443 length:219 start_codon:yes stop_codon:yes gene_type:complete